MWQTLVQVFKLRHKLLMHVLVNSGKDLAACERLRNQLLLLSQEQHSQELRTLRGF